MKKSKIYKRLRYYLRRLAYDFKLIRVLKSISREKYDEKISASLIYGFLSAVAVNLFFQSGHVYSSGATGLAQILAALSTLFRIYYSGFCDFLSHQYPADDFSLVSNWAQIYGIYFYNRFHEFAVYPVCS